MNKKPPQTSEIRDFIAYLEGKLLSPRQKLKTRASVMTAEVTAHVQHQSRRRRQIFPRDREHGLRTLDPFDWRVVLKADS